MSLCFDFDAGHWVTGPEGTRMRLEQLRAALPMLKVGHEKFAIDLKQKIIDGKVKVGVGSPQSPYSDAVYAHEKMIREYEALLRQETGEPPPAMRGDIVSETGKRYKAVPTDDYEAMLAVLREGIDLSLESTSVNDDDIWRAKARGILTKAGQQL